MNAALTYTNPRRHAEIGNWPMGRNKRGTAVFDVEVKPGKGERGVRVTRLDGSTQTTAPKTLTYACKVRIVDGSDGRTYLVELTVYGFFSVMSSDMQHQHETVHTDNVRHPDLMKLFAE
jgi:hypothetical protein